MKVVLYYMKDTSEDNAKANKKTATIALIQRGSEIARGVAICSVKDQFKYRGYLSGRNLALNRALKALNNERISGEIRRPDAIELLEKCGCEFCNHKVRYMPDLTDFEKQRLESAKNIEDEGWESLEDYIEDLTFEIDEEAA